MGDVSSFRAEFEYRQFLLYEERRSSIETHTSATIAAAFVAVAFVSTTFADRADHSVALTALLGIALLGIAWSVRCAFVGRTANWYVKRPPRPFREPEVDLMEHEGRLGDRVGESLEEFRSLPPSDLEANAEQAERHWRRRALSAWQLGLRQKEWLRASLWGFALAVPYLVGLVAGV